MRVLAGRPHGTGLMWKRSAADTLLAYHGEWSQGRQEGDGTLYYKRGEVYDGTLLRSTRHGNGRLVCSDLEIVKGILKYILSRI